MNKYIAILGGAGLALALTVTGCSAQPTAPAEDQPPFNLVFIAGTSGVTADLVSDYQRAIEIAIDDVNADGGILGREVVLEVLDDQADPAQAVSVLQERLASGEKPDLVFAGVSSAEALAMLPVLANENIPATGMGASPLLDTTEEFPLYRSLVVNLGTSLQLLPEKLEAENVEKLVVLTSQDGFGEGTLAAVSANIDDIPGLEVVKQTYDPAALDLTTAFQRAVEEKPDAVFFDCYGAPCPRLFEARDRVPGADDLLLLGGTGVSQVDAPSSIASEQAQANFEFIVWQSQIVSEEPTEAFTSFTDRFDTSDDVDNLNLGAIAYDAIRLWAKAADAAGSTEAEAVIAEVDAGVEADPGYWLTSDEMTFEEGHTLVVHPISSFAFIPGSSVIQKGLFVVN